MTNTAVVARPTVLQRILMAILYTPHVHKRPDAVAARAVWDEKMADAESSVPRATRRNRHERAVALRAAQKEAEDLALDIISDRTGLRGQSMGSTLAFLAFLTVSQMTLIGFGFVRGTLFPLLAVVPTIIGLIAIMWGIMPSYGAIFPHERGDEGVQVAKMTKFDWFMERVRRSSAQREQLWKLRVGMTIALPLTAMTLVIFPFTYL